MNERIKQLAEHAPNAHWDEDADNIVFWVRGTAQTYRVV